MSHISSRKLGKQAISELEKNLDIILVDVSGGQRMKILKEVITKTERLMIAKRIALVFLLGKGMSSYKISKYLGISPSTAERFQHLHETGKFRETDRLLKKYRRNRLLKLVTDLFAAFYGPRKSLNQLLKEL